MTGPSDILMQQRVDGTSFFDVTWNDFKSGFVSVTGNFWLGNDYIHQLTTDHNCKLRSV